ncbi:MAG: dihydroorotase [Clostridia bacterium]|nr:dihydroorotase [Clostridia bacterium]
MSAIKLINARIIDPANNVDMQGEILVKNGVIVKVAPKVDECADEVIDCNGAVAAPGLVDIHVHLRDPGQTHKEDILTGANAAAAGGVTSIVAMPNTVPAVDSVETINYILDKAKDANAKVYQAAAITKGLCGEETVDFEQLKSAGAAAFSDDGRPVENTAFMLKALQEANRLNVPVLSHCEDLYLAKGGIMHKGEVSEKLGVNGIPAAAEDCGTARDISLAESSGLPVHICHVSTKTSLLMIADAKNRGVKVTCETGPHYFTLDHTELLSRDANFRMNPPLRTKSDVSAVISAIKNGVVDAIATDHAPHSVSEKSDFEKAPNGIVGMETSLAVSYTALVKTGVITLNRLIELMSVKPAEIMNISAGTLSVGKAADIVVFDPDEQFVVDKTKLHGKSQNTPFDGCNLSCKVKYTLLDGKIVYKD